MLLAALGTASRGGEHGPRFFFPLLLLLLLGLLVGKIVRHRRGGPSPRYRHGSPVQTLEHRFARGEIDRAEFDHRKAVLDGSDDIPPAPANPAPAQQPPVDSHEDAAAEPVDSPDPVDGPELADEE